MHLYILTPLSKSLPIGSKFSSTASGSGTKINPQIGGGGTQNAIKNYEHEVELDESLLESK